MPCGQSPKCSQGYVLIKYDNHKTHMHLQAINFAKDRGIVLLTLHPHCSHKFHPTDGTDFGPFERFYNTGYDASMLRKPGTSRTIYDVAEVVEVTYSHSFYEPQYRGRFPVL